MFIKSLITLSCVAVLLGASGFVLNQPIVQQTITLATTATPENFTELYFENHTELPSQVNPHDSYSFQFTIHNHENKTIKYTYEVIRYEGKSTVYLQRDHLTIPHGEYISVSVPFEAPSLLQRSKIIVRLTNMPQEINFWIEESK